MYQIELVERTEAAAAAAWAKTSNITTSGAFNAFIRPRMVVVIRLTNRGCIFMSRKICEKSKASFFFFSGKRCEV